MDDKYKKWKKELKNKERKNHLFASSEAHLCLRPPAFCQDTPNRNFREYFYFLIPNTVL